MKKHNRDQKRLVKVTVDYEPYETDDEHLDRCLRCGEFNVMIDGYCTIRCYKRREDPVESCTECRALVYVKDMVGGYCSYVCYKRHEDKW